MTASDFDREWEKLAREVVSGMKEWRIQHPRATWKELEEALDQRLNRMRARLLEDMALASEAARLQEEGARARCPQCGEPLASRGKRKRRLQTNGGEEIVLERRYGVCPTCQAGIFPLDEELQLLPGGLTPNLAEELTHLGAWMPFEQAREMLRRMRGVAVSEATVRRQTERNGAAYVSVQEAEVERIEHEQPEAPIGPEKQVLSVDGAMAPLVGGAWAEVKTLVAGVLGEPVIDGAEQHVHARELSYFSRLLEAEAFTRLALTEIQRRGGREGRESDCGHGWGRVGAGVHRLSSSGCGADFGLSARGGVCGEDRGGDLGRRDGGERGLAGAAPPAPQARRARSSAGRCAGAGCRTSGPA